MKSGMNGSRLRISLMPCTILQQQRQPQAHLTPGSHQARRAAVHDYFMQLSYESTAIYARLCECCKCCQRCPDGGVLTTESTTALAACPRAMRARHLPARPAPLLLQMPSTRAATCPCRSQRLPSACRRCLSQKVSQLLAACSVQPCPAAQASWMGGLPPAHAACCG